MNQTLSTEKAKETPLTTGFIFDTKPVGLNSQVEERIDTSKEKQSWGFLGKLKKFFLGNVPQPKDDEDE